MNVVELKQKLINQILAKEINFQFMDNSAFKELLSRAVDSLVIHSSEFEIVEDGNKILITFKDDKNRNNRITIDCSNPDQIHCMQVCGVDDIARRQKFEQKIILTPGGGLEFHQNEAERTSINGDQYLYLENSQSLVERYDRSGIMTYKKKAIYQPYKHSDSIGIGDMLYAPRNYHDYNVLTTEFSMELYRISHDVVSITCEGVNTFGYDMSYKGYFPVNNLYYVKLPSLDNIRAMRGNFPGTEGAIEPLSEEDLYHDLVLANLSSEQVRFLIELANNNNRKDFSFEPNKSGGLKK